MDAARRTWRDPKGPAQLLEMRGGVDRTATSWLGKRKCGCTDWPQRPAAALLGPDAQAHAERLGQGTGPTLRI